MSLESDAQKPGVSHSSLKVKLRALWSPLVAGCSTGHNPALSVQTNGTSVKIKKNELHFQYNFPKYGCGEWGGAESRGNGARPVE